MKTPIVLMVGKESQGTIGGIFCFTSSSHLFGKKAQLCDFLTHAELRGSSQANVVRK